MAYLDLRVVGKVVSERINLEGHAFISYVRDDSPAVDRLQLLLEAAGIRVWRDIADLWPGDDWRFRIRRAITDDALAFIACFSQSSVARDRSYQYEELTLAIDQLRQRRPEQPWLIPVRFDECEIPDRDLGGGRTLASLHRVDLFGERSGENAARLVTAVQRILARQPGAENAQARQQVPSGQRRASGHVRRAAESAGPPSELGVERRYSDVVSAFADASKWHQVYMLGLPGTLKRDKVFGRKKLIYQPAVRSVAFSPDNKFLAIGSGGSEVYLRHTGNGELAVVLSALSGTADDTDCFLDTLAFSPSGRHLVGGRGWKNGVGVVWQWSIRDDAGSSVKYPSVLGGHNKDTGRIVIVFRPSGGPLATGDNEAVRIWGSDRPLAIVHPNGVDQIAFSPDSSLVASSCTKDQTVRVWRLGTDMPTATVIGRTGAVVPLAFSPEGVLLAAGARGVVGGSDKTFQLWRADPGELTLAATVPLSGYGAATVSSIAATFNPDGTLLATGGADNVVRLWRTDTGELAATLVGNTSWPSMLVFSPDGSLLATSDLENKVRLWRTDISRPAVTTLVSGTGLVQGIAFSPDSMMLAAGNLDGTTCLWRRE